MRLKDLKGDGKLDAPHGPHGADGWSGSCLQGADPLKPWEFHGLSGPMREGTNLGAADLNGDGISDFSIQVGSTAYLTAGDFIF